MPPTVHDPQPPVFDQGSGDAGYWAVHDGEHIVIRDPGDEIEVDSGFGVGAGHTDWDDD